MFFYFRKLLFALKPEKAHHFTTSVLHLATYIPGLYALIRYACGTHKDKPISVMGITFKNPVGLAAGFDKDAQHLKVWKALGFGHIEMGTITPRPQSGNPQPRLFRLPKDKALINRMGFNNQGVKAAKERLMKRPEGLIVGGNIGKNKDTPNENAAQDYLYCFRELYDHVDYFTINISSPNTPGLRDLQTVTELERIVAPIVLERNQKTQQNRPYKPVLVKLSPDLSSEDLLALVQWVNQSEVDGVVFSNTTLDRSNLLSPESDLEAIGNGGLSGLPLQAKATRSLGEVSQILDPRKVLIGVGGIMASSDAQQKQKNGAHLVQIYTGFVYHGPALVGRILKNWQ